MTYNPGNSAGATAERRHHVSITIKRGPLPTDHFTIISNAWVRDESLPWASRGLLAWMASHSADFVITEEKIIAAGPAERSAVRSMTRALEQAGYLRRERTPIVTGGSSVAYVLADPRAGENRPLGNGRKSPPRPDQGEQDVSAVQPNDGKSPPRTTQEDQEKTKTPSVSKRAPRSTTATRVPDDFQPDENMRAWFVAEKLPGVIDGRMEHDRFMDYWRAAPGVKGRKADWPATWRNWMRSAAERATRNGYVRPVSAPPGNSLVPSGIPTGPYRPSTTDQKLAQTLELGRRLQAQMEETQ